MPVVVHCSTIQLCYLQIASVMWMIQQQRVEQIFYEYSTNSNNILSPVYNNMSVVYYIYYTICHNDKIWRMLLCTRLNRSPKF